MNIYSNPYHYRGTLFYIESISNRYLVRISYQSPTINQTALSNFQEYKTPSYPFANQAIRYATGWVNRMLDRHFSENKDSELLDSLEEIGSRGVTNEQLDSAYWEGWKTKDDELNNI
jgi:hypothetical protein